MGCISAKCNIYYRVHIWIPSCKVTGIQLSIISMQWGQSHVVWAGSKAALNTQRESSHRLSPCTYRIPHTYHNCSYISMHDMLVHTHTCMECSQSGGIQKVVFLIVCTDILYACMHVGIHIFWLQCWSLPWIYTLRHSPWNNVFCHWRQRVGL